MSGILRDAMIDRLMRAMAESAARDYGAEHVSELEHALQCAELAAAAGADEQLTLACLLHDVGRYAVDQGMVPAAEPLTVVNIETPCGLVAASVEVRDGKAGAVSFESVPAFLFAADRTVELSGYGKIGFDVAYGGAFYALADCRRFGLEFGRDRVRDFVDAATALTEKLKAEFPLSHPDHADLAFLYGTILTDGGDGSERPTRNVCVFAEAEVDRSPSGSGVTARLAARHARGEVGIGESRTFESIAGSRFTGAVARTTQAGEHQAVVARVGGRAFYSGTAEFTLEEDDELGRGFLLQ